MRSSISSLSEQSVHRLNESWMNFLSAKPISYISCAVDYGSGMKYQFASGSSMHPEFQEREITVDTRFQVGSVTKVITSLLSAMLVDQKLLHPEDRVVKYLPKYVDTEVTLRHLMTHTAGYRVQGADKPKRGNRQEYLDHIYALNNKDYALGNESVYFSAGYAMMVDVIELTTGTSFDALAKELIFLPLGLHSATWNEEECDEHGYVLPSEPHSLEVTNRYAQLEVSGESGLFINTTDLLTLGRFFLNKGIVDGKQLISEHALSLMMKDQTENQFARSWGLFCNTSGNDHGCFSRFNSNNAVAHTGFSGCMWLVDPTHDATMAILTGSQLLHRETDHYRDAADRFMREGYILKGNIH